MLLLWLLILYDSIAVEALSCDCFKAIPCDVIRLFCQVILCHLFFSNGDFEWWAIVRNSLQKEKGLVTTCGISYVGSKARKERQTHLHCTFVAKLLKNIHVIKLDKVRILGKIYFLMLFCLFSSSAEDYVQSLQIGAFSQNLHENIQNKFQNVTLSVFSAIHRMHLYLIAK